jgi:hypothetical protein
MGVDIIPSGTSILYSAAGRRALSACPELRLTYGGSWRNRSAEGQRNGLRWVMREF